MGEKILYAAAALPAVLLCFGLATGFHFLIFGGKIIPAVGMGAYMTVMFAAFLVSGLSSPASTAQSE